MDRLRSETLTCPILIAAVKRNTAAYICRDGVYYYKDANGLELPFIPSSMYADIIADYHMPAMSGHIGVNKVFATMRNKSVLS